MIGSITGNDEKILKGESYLRLVTRRFFSNKLAVFGLTVAVFLVLVAIFAPWIAPFAPELIDTSNILKPPSFTHILGTDELGRDVLSRLLFGTRISLSMVSASIASALLLGTSIGLISGYLGGLFDSVVMRVVDGLLAFPTLVLALAVVSILGPSAVNAAIAIAIVTIPNFARYARSEVFVLKNAEYIDSARVSGVSTPAILVTHFSRAIAGPVLVYASLLSAMAILAEASLAFLGLGAQPPTPSWGGMVSIGSRYLESAWWTSVFPGLTIFLAIVAFNLIGDGLNDALNVRRASSRSSRRRRRAIWNNPLASLNRSVNR